MDIVNKAQEFDAASAPLRDKVAALEARCAELEKALRTYGRHRPDAGCAGRLCLCGFSAALGPKQ